MKSELIVDVSANEVSIALLEDSRLVSLQKEARNISYAVGDIYLAKVKKLMPGLNAAFVNVGYEKDAFLHYLDLGSHFASYSDFVGRLLDDKKNLPSVKNMKLLPDIDKHGTVSDLLQSGRELLVQIVKEPISSKGPRLTTEITFTGRFLVLIPFSDKISISQKIKSTEEKLRLRKLIESIKPKNFGVIVRTSAEGKRVAELNHELKTLVQCWDEAVAKAQTATAPSLIFEEESRIVGMLRDVFSPSFESIYVNDQATFSQIQKYVALIAPERADIVKLYSKPEPIFDHFSITRQIKSSFGKTVSFKSGAYIIIEHTEALHVIDVNSGNRSKATNDQETNALEVNLRAADEIARQLRLRDMGGIIVIDFIDMNKSEHRQQLYEHMREVMANDRARHNILPLSKFGLMQITRQRVRPALDITTTETCPSCFGKGEVQPSLLFTDTLREKLDYVVNSLGLKGFIMYVHPFVDAYIKKGLIFSMYRKWRTQLGRCFKIIPDQSLAYLQYRVVDSNGTELDLREDKDTNSSSTDKKNKAKKRLDGSENIADVSDDSTAAKSQKQKAKSKTKAKAAKPRQDMADGNTTQNDACGEVADSSAENSGSDTAVSVPAEKKPQPKNRKTSRPKAEKEATGESEDNTKTAEARDTRRKPANKANKKVTDIDDSADGGTLVQTEAVPAEVLQTESVPAETLQKESVQSEDAAVQESAKADATRHKPVRQQPRRRTAPKVKTAEIADAAEKVTELPDVPVVRADHLLAAVGRQEANPDTAQE